MTPQTATILYVTCILGLFYLDRDPKVRSSIALWIPVAWFLIIASRPVTEWLQSGPTISKVQQYEEGSPVDAAVFQILIAAGVVVLCLRSRQVSGILRRNLPVLLFFAYCAVSIAWSDFPFIALKRWIKAVGDLVMVLIVLTDPNPLAAAKRFYARAAFLLLPLSLLFIKYYPNIGRAYNQWTWTPVYGGVTEGKNELGMTCLVCGLGSLWSLVGALEDRKMPNRVRRIVAHGVIFAMAIWLCKLCNSMTSLSCLIMTGIVMVMTTRRWIARHTSAVHALVGGFAALSLFALFFDTGGGLVESLGRDPSLTGRTAIWNAVLSLHTNPLVGTGFESFWMGSRMEHVWEILREPGIQSSHDGYLELYLNLGLVGIALLLLLIVTGYRNALAALRHDSYAGSLRIAFFTTGVIYSTTEAGFRMMSPVWIAFLLATTFVPAFILSEKPQLAFESNARQYRPPAETESIVQGRAWSRGSK